MNDVEIEDGFSGTESKSVPYQPLPLPKPPAGFILDDQGRVVMVSPKRIATIVSPFIYFVYLSLVLLNALLAD